MVLVTCQKREMKESMKVLHLVFFSSFVLIFSEISIAADTITRYQSISDNQTLVSANETFELGFFSPGNPNSRYLGIWYKNPPTKTVVWVANRDNPLTNSTGILRIGEDGNLILVNQTDSVIWSTNSSGVVVSDPIVQLMESGNLVLSDSKIGHTESYIWQSFDYPSDTLLPGMKLGWNLKTGLDRYLTSWKSSDDPSSRGDFSCGIENPELPQLVVRQGLMKQNRIGPWNGVLLSGSPALMGTPIFIPHFIYNTDEVYYMSERVPNSIVSSRIVLNSSGLLEFRFWNYQSHDWSVMFTLQQKNCDLYGLCGPNGVCDINDSPPCKCLKGFTPKSPQQWALLNFSSGCVRGTQLDCEKGDKFKKFPGMQLPDVLSYWLNTSMSLKKCEAECLKNCSCMAYANSDVRGGGSGCILWFKELFDMRVVSNGGQDLYIRLAASEVGSNTWINKTKKRIILSAVLGLFLFGLVIYCIILKRRQNRTGDIIIHSQEREYRDESREEDLGLPLFDWITVARATNNFSFSNKIGEGGFGPVYKGVLATGQEIAVKRLSKNSGQGLEEFKNEVILIAKLQHRNLVRLLGCCIQGEERVLIYEYLPNKSLDYFIFDRTRTNILDWRKRFDIIVGIARGLLYLHRDSRLRIIHRDLKAGNILLDSQMNPKISDFGMARTFGGDQTEAKTKRVVGTYGYMSPEYAIDGLFSMKSDVFSLGVLVLEIVSGMRNRGFNHSDHDLNLLGHAWKLWNEGKALELVDALIKDSFPVSEVLKCIQVGLLCLQKRTEDRPTMSSVLLMLDGESATLPQPNEPGFYTGRSLVETESSSSRDKSVSGNRLTITMIEGR